MRRKIYDRKWHKIICLKNTVKLISNTSVLLLKLNRFQFLMQRRKNNEERYRRSKKQLVKASKPYSNILPTFRPGTWSTQATVLRDTMQGLFLAR